jgi:hypothetical protein
MYSIIGSIEVEGVAVKYCDALIWHRFVLLMSWFSHNCHQIFIPRGSTDIFWSASSLAAYARGFGVGSIWWQTIVNSDVVNPTITKVVKTFCLKVAIAPSLEAYFAVCGQRLIVRSMCLWLFQPHHDCDTGYAFNDVVAFKTP